MWYIIINLILRLYNILGLVSGKFGINRLYIYWKIASWSAASLLTKRCTDHVHYCRCVGDIYLNLNLSGLSKFRPTHNKIYMPRKKNLFSLQLTIYNWQLTFGIEEWDLMCPLAQCLYFVLPLPHLGLFNGSLIEGIIDIAANIIDIKRNWHSC